jgi:acetyl-CoA carboxylase beta subunit
MVSMRTTIDIDDTVLAELRERRRREGRSLGQVASELLARALADTASDGRVEPLVWSSQSMGARVDLDDRDAVAAVLDAGR